MTGTIPRRSRIVLSWAAAAMIAVVGAGQAQAGECPADKVLQQPRKIEDVAEKHLKRETLAVIPLKGWRGVGDLLLRTRRLTIGRAASYPPTTTTTALRSSTSSKARSSNTAPRAPSRSSIAQANGAPEFGDFHGHWWRTGPGATWS